MRKGPISAGSGGTTAPSLNGTEGTFQTPRGRCVLRALCNPQAGLLLPFRTLQMSSDVVGAWARRNRRRNKFATMSTPFLMAKREFSRV